MGDNAMTVGVNGSSPIKRQRRTRTEMDAIQAGLCEILEEQHPATVRGTFYQAVSRGIVAKTETEYKSTVIRLLSDMRRSAGWPDPVRCAARMGLRNLDMGAGPTPCKRS